MTLLLGRRCSLGLHSLGKSIRKAKHYARKRA
jgi:hypothetical protein